MAEKEKIEKNLFFFARKSRLDEARTTVGRNRTVLYKHIRPTGNELEGYVPSKVINRFQREASLG